MMNIVDKTLDNLKRNLKPRHPKFGVTYTAVSTSDDSGSGTVGAGIINASNLASQMLMSLGTSRSCAIAIANASGCRLVDPQIHVCSGTTRPAPYIIEHGYTGLIGTEKASGVYPRGTSGVVTYELDTKMQKHLQIMWSVPNDFHLFDSWVNVSVGDTVACSELFKDMYKGKVGEVVKAKDTCRIFKVAADARVEVAMSEDGRCTLVVKIFRE